MKKKIVFLIILIVVSFLSLIFLSLTVWGFFGLEKQTNEVDNVVHIQELPVFFEVTDQRIVGINIDTDALKFGTIMRGNFAKRDITIVNPFQISIDVEIGFSESIENIVEISQDSFSLDIDDSLKVTITIRPDENTEIGKHEGVLTLIMKRAKVS